MRSAGLVVTDPFILLTADPLILTLLFRSVTGNTVQFALGCQSVVAVDLDQQRLHMAQHNASLYGVAAKVQFHCGTNPNTAQHNSLCCALRCACADFQVILWRFRRM